MIKFIEDKELKEEISRNILSELPDWFGMPSAIDQYAVESRNLPFWSATLDGKNIGFLTIKETSPHTVELFVMGVLKDFHGNGIGRKLFDACYKYSKENNYSFIQVKTVKEGCYREYDLTIAFYKKVGFKEFECINEIWDEENPCQIFAMNIK